MITSGILILLETLKKTLIKMENKVAQLKNVQRHLAIAHLSTIAESSHRKGMRRKISRGQHYDKNLCGLSSAMQNRCQNK